MAVVGTAKAKEQIKVRFDDLSSFEVTLGEDAAVDLLTSLALSLGPDAAIKAIIAAVRKKGVNAEV